MLLQRVDPAFGTEAPPTVLGPFLAEIREVTLLHVLADFGSDADIVVALFGDLRAFPESGQPVEKGQVE